MNKPLKLPENGFEVLASDGGGKITFERLTISPENMKTLQRENERLKGAVQEWVDGVCISQKHLSQIGILQQENERYKSVLKQARVALEEIEKCCEINVDDGYHTCQRKCREAAARARFFRGVIDELERSEC